MKLATNNPNPKRSKRRAMLYVVRRVALKPRLTARFRKYAERPYADAV